jgi:hypothetical protein
VESGSLIGADGIFYSGSTTSVADILDGTSHTVAFSERTMGLSTAINAEDDPRPPNAIWEISDASEPTVAACGSKTNGGWYLERGAKWIMGNYGNTIYNHYFSPNSSEWDCMNVTQRFGLMSARSDHPGGVSILRCDSSVDFLDNNIEIQVWRAMSTRSGDGAHRR